jgi:hypothetical protein
VEWQDEHWDRQKRSGWGWRLLYLLRSALLLGLLEDRLAREVPLAVMEEFCLTEWKRLDGVSMRTSSVRRFLGEVVGVTGVVLLTPNGSGLDCGTEVAEEIVPRADWGVVRSSLEDEGVLVSSLWVWARNLSKN